MFQEELVATPPDSGVTGQQPVSQDPGQTPQGSPQDQDPASSQVETTVQETSRRGTERPRPSDFYRDRQRFRNLEGTIKQQSDQLKQMQALLEGLKSSVPAKASEPNDEFKINWDDPEKSLKENFASLKKAMQDKIEEIKSEIPSFISKHEVEKSWPKQEQEALEILFPKGPDLPEDLETRVNSDAKRLDRVHELFNLPHIARLAQISPVDAAKLVADKLEIEALKKQKEDVRNSPLAPKKAQMVGTTSSTVSGGGKKMITKEDAVKRFSQITERLSQNSNLINDPKFMEEMNLLSKELESNK